MGGQPAQRSARDAWPPSPQQPEPHPNPQRTRSPTHWRRISSVALCDRQGHSHTTTVHHDDVLLLLLPAQPATPPHPTHRHTTRTHTPHSRPRPPQTPTLAGRAGPAACVRPRPTGRRSSWTRWGAGPRPAARTAGCRGSPRPAHPAPAGGGGGGSAARPGGVQGSGIRVSGFEGLGCGGGGTCKPSRWTWTSSTSARPGQARPGRLRGLRVWG